MSIKPLIAISLTLGATLLMAFVSCSLGDGVTPECDPSAAPDQANACFQVTACDTGNGGVKAEESCCVEAGNKEFAVCDGADVSGDFRDRCVPGSTMDPNNCCGDGTRIYNLCIDGLLMGGSTASTGGGGSGGMRTGSGNASAGGGGSTGTNGTGGAGGGGGT